MEKIQSSKDKNISDEDKCREILSSFSALLQMGYGYKVGGDKVKAVMESGEISDWVKKLEVKIQQEQPKERELDEILKLIGDSSKDVDLEGIRKDFNAIEEMSELNSDDDLKSWAKSISPSNFDKIKVISGLKRASVLKLKKTPRTVQLVSLLIMIREAELKKKSGILLRIATGEGKSLTIAMLAAYFRLTKQLFIDIVSPSSILASRDEHDFSEFYNVLGLSHGTLTLQPEPNFYDKDIIYGEISHFQSHVLQELFHFDGIRKSRGFGVCIVDEVDSMLIDHASCSTKLVDPIPGVEFVEPIFGIIWANVRSMQNLVVPIEDNTFIIQDLKATNPKKLVDMLAKISNGKHGNAETLKRVLTRFANAMEAEELNSDDKERMEDLMTLIENGYIAGKLPTVDDGGAQFRQIIRNRWNMSIKPSLLQICEKYLGRRIQIWKLDAAQGIYASPDYHPTDKTDTPSYFPLMHLMEMDGQLVELVEVSDTNSDTVLLNRVANSVQECIVYTEDVAKDQEGDEEKKEPRKEEITKLRIPSHFKPLVEFKLNRWIRSAFTALYHVVQDQDYIVQKAGPGVRGRIVPVDFEHTGVLEETSVWPDGLHQFLQLKHSLALSPDQITTNFLSNLSFFQNYKEGGCLFGVTGTLGSESERKMLLSAYSVATADIPEFQEKRHRNLENAVLEQSESWREAIVSSAVTHAQLDRAVLITCQSISEANGFTKVLEKLNDEKYKKALTLISYTNSSNPEEMAKATGVIGKGTIIVATTLAGRGTDLSLEKEVIDNGGLHVILTFFPPNLRVEHQAVGRASRNGQPGSSQMIIIAQEDAPKKLEFGQRWIREGIIQLYGERAVVEKEIVDEIISTKIPMLQSEETKFKQYCEIRKKLYQSTGNELDRKFALLAIDEGWGLALDKSRPVDESGKSREKLSAELSSTISSLSGDSSIKNPQTWMLKGVALLGENKFGEAITAFDEAIKSEKKYASNAYYYKAYARIRQGGEGAGYKNDAKEALQESLIALTYTKIPALMGAYSFATGASDASFLLDSKAKKKLKDEKKEEADSDYTQQTKGRMHLMQLQMKSIEKAAEEIDKATQGSREIDAKLIRAEDFLAKQEGESPISADEFKEAAEEGMIGFIEIQNRPTPWYTWLTIALVSLLEIAGGAVLAVFTGGLFGVGLIVDGLVDVAFTIKAAINGEYVSLKEFFINKAISMAIMALTFGAGALVSKFGPAIARIAGSIGSKFLGSTLGGMAKGLFKFGRKIWQGFKKVVTKVVTNIKEFGNKIWSKLKKFGQKIMNMMKRIGAKLKLDKALKNIGKLFNKIKSQLSRLATLKSGKYFWEPFVKKIAPESIRARQASYIFKLIAKESARRGVLEGIDWAINKELLPRVKAIISAAILENVTTTVRNEMDGDSGKVLEKFLGQATMETGYKEEYNLLINRISSMVDNDFLVTNNKGMATVFRVFNSVGKEIGTTLQKQFSSSKTALKLATIITKYSNLITEITRDSVAINEMLTYTRGLFKKFKDFVDQDPFRKEPTDEAYIRSKEGAVKFKEDKEKIIKLLSEHIASQLVNIVLNGLVVPRIKYRVNKFVSNLSVFNTKDYLEKLGEIQKANGHPERFPDASVWDIMKGPNRYVRDKGEQGYYENKDGDRIIGYAITSNKRIDIYTLGNDRRPVLENSFGNNNSADEEPVRILDNGSSSSMTGANDVAVRYQPIVRDVNGQLAAVEVPPGIRISADDAQDRTHAEQLIAAIVMQERGDVASLYANLKYYESKN